MTVFYATFLQFNSVNLDNNYKLKWQKIYLKKKRKKNHKKMFYFWQKISQVHLFTVYSMSPLWIGQRRKCIPSRIKAGTHRVTKAVFWEAVLFITPAGLPVQQSILPQQTENIIIILSYMRIILWRITRNTALTKQIQILTCIILLAVQPKQTPSIYNIYHLLTFSKHFWSYKLFRYHT